MATKSTLFKNPVYITVLSDYLTNHVAQTGYGSDQVRYAITSLKLRSTHPN
jgi:hypothetical protein